MTIMSGNTTDTVDIVITNITDIVLLLQFDLVLGAEAVLAPAHSLHAHIILKKLLNFQIARREKLMTGTSFYLLIIIRFLVQVVDVMRDVVGLKAGKVELVG